MSIGGGNLFYPQTPMIAESGDRVTIGSGNQFGDNAFFVKANVVGSHIQIAVRLWSICAGFRFADIGADFRTELRAGYRL